MLPKLDPLPSMSDFALGEEIKAFRRVIIQEGAQLISSRNQALAMLDHDPTHAQTLQYIGWSYLKQADTATAILFLGKSIDSGP